MWKNMLEKSICSIFFIAKGKIWHAIEYKHWIIEKGRWIHMNNEKWFWMMEKIDFSPFVKINLVNREIFYYYLFIIFVVAVVVIFYYYYLKKNMSFLYFCICRPKIHRTNKLVVKSKNTWNKIYFLFLTNSKDIVFIMLKKHAKWFFVLFLC